MRNTITDKNFMEKHTSVLGTIKRQRSENISATPILLILPWHTVVAPISIWALMLQLKVCRVCAIEATYHIVNEYAQ